MDALEVAGKIFNLPALVGADLLALLATAGANLLSFSRNSLLFRTGRLEVLSTHTRKKIRLL